MLDITDERSIKIHIWLTVSMLPPWASTSFLVIASPNPVPLALEV